MGKLKLTLYPDKLLRKKLKKVETVTDEERQILKDMLPLMYAVGGVGLAANQAGIDKQLFVVDLKDGKGPLFVINPRIVKKEGAASMEEGCLSIPGKAVKVKRAARVVVEGVDIDGKAIKIKAEGLVARALQHEIDHLNGRLIIDYLKFPAKFKISAFFKRRKKKGGGAV